MGLVYEGCRMLREFCAENLAGVAEALQAGARRVELCDDLSVGGVSPSREIIRQAVGLVHELGGLVMVMVRPRGGDFAYDDGELAVMEQTIRDARELGADGVVFGCVRNGELDLEPLRRLVAGTEGLDLTFHMAFDELASDRQGEALATLAHMGFSRVLTHGGPLSQPIDACIPHLRELVRAAHGEIVIMPGGGVTWENAEAICDDLGVDEAHGTRIVRLP